MAFVDVQNLHKVFRIPKKGEGLRGAVRHLFSQQYEDKVAIDGIDLAIEAGESIAYVGPNGAGKSTTVKILSGILVPSSGTVRVNGYVPHRQRVDYVRQIGVVFGQRTHLWWDLPVVESLKLLKEIYAIPDPIYRRNIDLFCELLGLDTLMPVPVRRLSLGQRMRADLAAALLHNPPLVFLDEPTIGLDVAVKETVRHFIRQINVERGTTILLTSHDLEDIEHLCQRMIIIDHGKIVYDGSLSAMKQQFSRYREVHLTLHSSYQRMDAEDAELSAAGIEITLEQGHAVRARFDRGRSTAADVVGQLMRLYDVADFELREPSIEQVLRSVYRGEFALTLARNG